MIQTVLVIGGSAIEREVVIAKLLGPPSSTDFSVKKGVLLEGLADEKSILLPNENLIISRIASGCICCGNNMIMRVYFNRLLQQKPFQLFLSLSDALHLPKIKEFLSAPSYLKVLELTDVINLESIKR